MKIWLDDERPIPDSSWTLCKTYMAFHDTVMYHLDKIETISFDHDLGDFRADDEKTGYDAICLIEELVYFNKMTAPRIRIHTANMSAKRKMIQTAQHIMQMGIDKQS